MIRVFLKVQAVRSTRSLVSAQSLLALVPIGVMFGSRCYILIVFSRRLVSAQSLGVYVPFFVLFASRCFILVDIVSLSLKRVRGLFSG